MKYKNKKDEMKAYYWNEMDTYKAVDDVEKPFMEQCPPSKFTDENMAEHGPVKGKRINSEKK